RRVMSAGSFKPSPGPCARLILAVFGSLFLIALLSVPVTTWTSQLRQDPDSRVVFKTTYPRNSTMFLPHCLSLRARAADHGYVHVRSAQWIGTMVIIAVLGVFDYVVFCRLWRRRRRLAPEGL
ncbi:MAG: hypothetical protein ACXW2V_09265, partial [Candidatus Aminicenantales bacterium]